MSDKKKDKSSPLNGASILKFVPAFIGIAYIFGFVIINSYLSKFNFLDDNFLSIKYLSVGLTFLIFITPVIAIVVSYYHNPTDDRSITKGTYSNLITIIVAYGVIIDFITFDSDREPNYTGRIIFGVLLLISGLTMYLTSYKYRNMSVSNKSIIVLVPLLIYYFLSSFFLPIIPIIKPMLIFIGIGIFVIYGLIGDRNFSYFEGSMYLFALIFFASIFGNQVYGKLPNYLGGAKPINIKCYIDENKTQLFENIGFEISERFTFDSELLYQSKDKYLFKIGDKVVTIKDEMINSFEIILNENSKDTITEKSNQIRFENKNIYSVRNRRARDSINKID